MKHLIVVCMSLIYLAAPSLAQRTTSSQRDAVIKFLNPQLYGRDNPTTVEGRTAASGMTPDQVLNTLQKWLDEEVRAYEDGKYSKGQLDEQMKSIEGWTEEVLKLTGRSTEDIRKEVEQSQLREKKRLRRPWKQLQKDR